MSVCPPQAPIRWSSLKLLNIPSGCFGASVVVSCSSGGLYLCPTFVVIPCVVCSGVARCVRHESDQSQNGQRLLDSVMPTLLLMLASVLTLKRLFFLIVIEKRLAENLVTFLLEIFVDSDVWSYVLVTWSQMSSFSDLSQLLGQPIVAFLTGELATLSVLFTFCPEASLPQLKCSRCIFEADPFYSQTEHEVREREKEAE